MRVACIYKFKVGEDTFAAFYEVPDFPTSGVDCDTPEILELLLKGFKKRRIEEGMNFHRVGAIKMPETTDQFWEGSRILAFYADRRAKALIERFDTPIVL